MSFLLQTALANFQRRYPKVVIQEQLKDNVGLYAFKLFDKGSGHYAYFAAKGSMNGDEVSIHKKILELATAASLPIILSVGENADRFYRFMPADIAKSSWENSRGAVTMVNFSIKLSVSLQKKPDPPKPLEPDLFVASHPVVGVLNERLGPVEIPQLSEEQRAEIQKHSEEVMNAASVFLTAVPTEGESK